MFMPKREEDPHLYNVLWAWKLTAYFFLSLGFGFRYAHGHLPI